MNILPSIPPLRAMHALNSMVQVRALDARVIAQAYYKDFVITSPNANWVPEFPVIDKSGILNRADGLWGGHEYTRWPQLHSNEFFHHCCIEFHLTPQTNHINQDHIAFYDVQQTDMELTGGANDLGEPLGKIRDELLITLEQVFHLRSASVKKKYGAIDETSLRPFISQLISVGNAVIERLRSDRRGWMSSLSDVRALQRIILEFSGVIQYAVNVYPRMQCTPKTFHDKVLPVRGVFSTDSAIVQVMHRLGIPVWYFRPYGSMSDATKIFQVVKCAWWSTVLRSDHFIVKGRPLLYTISVQHDLQSSSLQVLDEAGTTAMIKRIHGIMSGRVALNPHLGLLTAPTVPSSQTPSSSSLAPSNTLTSKPLKERGQKKKDCDSRAAKTAPNPNYALQLCIPDSVDGSPDMPSFHPVVRAALEKVGIVNPVPNQPALYPLPPPFLLIHNDPDRSARLYLNYIQIRGPLRDMLLSGTTFQAVWCRVQMWRDALYGNYSQGQPLAEGFASPFVEKIYRTLPSTSSTTRTDSLPSDDVRPTKKQKRADIAAMKVTLGAEWSLPSFSPEMQPEWRGHPIPLSRVNSDKTLRMEVQWELAEMLFRNELWALDQKLVPREFMAREDIDTCIAHLSGVYLGSPDGKSNFLTDLSRPVAEYWDPVSPNRDSLRALREVLKRWPNSPQRLKMVGDVDMRDFPIMIEFYVNTFVKIFGRFPTLHCTTPSSLM